MLLFFFSHTTTGTSIDPDGIKTESASAPAGARRGHGRHGYDCADPPPMNVPSVIALFHDDDDDDDDAAAAATTKKASAEREVAAVAAATEREREAIRGRLLQYYEMHDVDHDPVTVTAYFNRFPGRDQAVLEALLSLHAMGMQASIHIDLPNLMDEYPAGAEAGMMEAIQNMASVGSIDTYGTTDLVIAPKSTLMPPPRNSSVVPFESSLTVAAKPPPQYDIDRSPQPFIDNNNMDIHDDVTQAMRDEQWNQDRQEAHNEKKKSSKHHHGGKIRRVLTRSGSKQSV